MAKANEAGLTPQEVAIMELLRQLHKEYRMLPPQHPTEHAEFLDLIHKLSALMALRAARSAYPDFWPTYYCDPNGRWLEKKVK